MIDDYLERHYPFEGCFNFRDIGGYLNQDGKRMKKGLYLRKMVSTQNKIVIFINI